MDMFRFSSSLDTLIQTTKRYATKIDEAYEVYRGKVERIDAKYHPDYAQEAKEKAWAEFETVRRDSKNNMRYCVNDQCEYMVDFIKEAYSKAPTQSMANLLNSLTLRNSLSKSDIEAAKITFSGNPQALQALRDMAKKNNLFLGVDIPSFNECMAALHQFKEDRLTSIESYMSVSSGDASQHDIRRKELAGSMWAGKPSQLTALFISDLGKPMLERIIIEPLSKL